MRMSLSVRRAITNKVRTRYQKANRGEKKVILNEFCATTGYNRVYAATLLRTGPTREPGREASRHAPTKPRGGRPLTYGGDIKRIIEILWKRFDFLCGKRLVALIRTSLPLLLPDASLRITDECAQALATISPATVDRLLAGMRARYRLGGQGYTRANSSLKDLIPVRTWSEWSSCLPGHMQLDTVGHDGGYLSTDCSFTLCATDVCTGWTERYAMKNRAFKWIRQGLDSFKTSLPFPIVHLHPDGGSEFINYGLLDYCKNADYPIDLSRSRPGKKNDNCYVEQKNFDAIRKLIGYARYPTEEMLNIMNHLYRVHGLLRNYFYPSQKLIEKIRKGGKVIKHYDRPQSPADRLLAHPNSSPLSKQRILITRASLHPLELAREVDRLMTVLQTLLKRYQQESTRESSENTGS